MRLHLVLSWSLTFAVAGCGWGKWLPILPDTRTPADRARELTARCKEDPGHAVDALTPAIVERVDGFYVWMHGGGSDNTRLRGANLHMRPSLSVPPAELQRALECHEANVTLGAASELPEDPYVLPGSWLDIHVSSTDEGLVAAVGTDSFEDARVVLGRAQRFVATPR
jgi:hypothetical protein